MKMAELLKALDGLKVETGSLACLGCEHEDQCSVKGCAIIREAMYVIEPFERAEKMICEGFHRLNSTEKVHHLAAEELPRYHIPRVAPELKNTVGGGTNENMQNVQCEPGRSS